MLCSNCGQENKENSKFCFSCGFKLVKNNSGEIVIKANRLLFWGGVVQILSSFIWFSIFFNSPEGAIPLKSLGYFGGILIIVLGIALIVLSKLNVKNLRINSYVILVLSIVNLFILVYGTPAAIMGFIAYRKIYKIIGPKEIISRASRVVSAISAETSQIQVKNANTLYQSQGVSKTKINNKFIWLAKLSLFGAFYFLLLPLRYFGYIIFVVFSDRVELANQGGLFKKIITDPSLIISAALFVVYFILMSKIKRTYQVADLSNNISEKDSVLINKRIISWGMVLSIWGGILFIMGLGLIVETSNFYDSYQHLAGVGGFMFLLIPAILLSGILSLIMGLRVLLLRKKDNLYLLKQSESISLFGWVLILAGVIPGVSLLLVSEALFRLKK